MTGYKRNLPWRDLGLGLCLAAAGVGLLLCPGEVIAAGRDGLALCRDIIVPSLFPFFVLSSLVVSLHLADYPGRALGRVMRPLFGVSGSGSAALVLGLIGGYPVGAKTVAGLFRSGRCTRCEAERLLGFCNNSGPAFLLGVVGAGIFGSVGVGFLLMGVHVAAALLVGLVFRFYTPGQTELSLPGSEAGRRDLPRGADLFLNAVKDSFQSMLNICAFILTFCVILQLLRSSGILGGLSRLLSLAFAPLGLNEAWGLRLLTGVLELSNGAAALQGTGEAGMILAAAMLGWGGVSVLLQTASVLQGSGLGLKTCVVGKALHALFSALLAKLTLTLLPDSVTAFSVPAVPVSQPFAPGFSLMLGVSLLLCALLAAVFLCGQHPQGEKRGGNQKKLGL